LSFLTTRVVVPLSPLRYKASQTQKFFIRLLSLTIATMCFSPIS